MEYLIKTRPMSFDQQNIIYEVDYQGEEVKSEASLVSSPLQDHNLALSNLAYWALIGLVNTVNLQQLFLQANSVPRAQRPVNGAGNVRNAPPPQFQTLAELSQAKKSAALQKHREWEEKKAARMGVPVEALRNSDGIGSPGSAGSAPVRKLGRTKRRTEKKKKTWNCVILVSDSYQIADILAELVSTCNSVLPVLFRPLG